MTHCRSEKVECRSCWMLGRATFTIVMSSRSMNVPRQTAASVHHFGSLEAPDWDVWVRVTEPFSPTPMTLSPWDVVPGETHRPRGGRHAQHTNPDQQDRQR